MKTLKNKTVLITGGTGSFGKTVAKRLSKLGAQEIRIFSRDEEKQDAMRNEYMDDKYRFFIGDVRDLDSVSKAMRKVDLVFHAAALKQVPSCEFFPLQAVQTNILGSANVVDAAVAEKVESVVCLSTDKAVLPINAMGMSKAMMEKVVQASSRALSEDQKTTLSCVRYGNVLYSRGSVIPLFIKQIKAKRDITITNPNMTRFLMPLDDAVDLVLYSFSNAQSGDLFVKKAPAGTVGDLATALMNIFQSGSATKQQVIGSRHGEKIFESLLSADEKNRSQDLGQYYQVPLDTRSLNYNKYFTDGNEGIASQTDYTSDNTERLTISELETLLLSLPEVQAELS